MGELERGKWLGVEHPRQEEYPASVRATIKLITLVVLYTR